MASTSSIATPNAGAALRGATLVITGDLADPSDWQQQARRMPEVENLAWSITTGYFPDKYGPYFGDWLPRHEPVRSAGDPPPGRIDRATRCLGAGGRLAPVDLAPVRDARDEHEPIGIVHRVDDPIVTDADPVVISAGELDDTCGPRLSRERIDRGADSLSQRTLKSSVVAHCCGMQSNLVRRLHVAYARTSAQETATSRSSRA